MGLLDLLYPPKCILCGCLLEKSDQDLCPSCRAEAGTFGKTYFAIAHTNDWTACWQYQDRVRSSLLRFKFGGQQHYAVAYGRQLALTARCFLQPLPDLVVYVPISWRRRLTRGYDQVELLAVATAKALGLPLCKAVRKIRHNRPQAGIPDPAMRRANVLGVYRVIRPEAVLGKRLLLIDDIVTTGATMAECARMLRLAGAASIHGLCVAAKK